MKTAMLTILIILATLSSVPKISSRTVCVRPHDTQSVFQVDHQGAAIAKLVGQVSNKITRDFLLDFLSSSGHSALMCEQKDMDTMVRDYQHCVRQVQHQLVCGVQGGVCDWVQTLVESCSQNILGQCLDRELVDLLMERQTETILQNRLLSTQNCEQNTGNDKITLLMKRIPLGDNLNRRHFLATKMLRLG